MSGKTIIEQSFDLACRMNSDIWLPANGGKEEPFISRSGIRLLYVYNPFLQKHAYMRLDRDEVISDQEAMSLMG